MPKNSQSSKSQTGSSTPQPGLRPEPVLAGLQNQGVAPTVESYLMLAYGVASLDELEGELRVEAEIGLRQAGLLNEPDQA